MQSNDVEYDLDAVTRKLQAMEARRKHHQSESNNSERSFVGFELVPADFSDSESDSTNSVSSDGEDKKLRIKDSLDLSMSVAMTEDASVLAKTTATKSRTRKALIEAKLLVKRPAVAWETKLQPDENSKQKTLPDRSSAFMNSRIPKLIQQRRQLKTVGQSIDEAKHERNTLRGDQVQSISREIADAGTRSRLHKTRDLHELTERPTAAKSSASLDTSQQKKLSNAASDSKVRQEPATQLKPSRSPARNQPEEMGSTTAEEKKLLQSLEKLDRRLSTVSAPPAAVREGVQWTAQPDVALKADRRTTEGPYSEIDNAVLRAASYGGGKHCRPGQSSSVAVRSSFLKREELSGGVHKARVRVGGALVNGAAGRSNNTDKSDKHKVVVKKELAHLLF